MATENLTGKTIATTYCGLIKTCDNNALTNSLKVLSDGDGNNSSLSIGCVNNGICITGNSEVNCNWNIGGTLDVTGTSTMDGLVTFGSNIIICGNCIQRETGTKMIEMASDTQVCITGCLIATDDIIAFCSSDKRMKDNLAKIDSSTIVNGLTGYSYDWNKNSNKEGKGIGVLAQDLQKVIPFAVKERDNNYLAVDYITLIPVLLEEVKRLNNEILELKTKINN